MSGGSKVWDDAAVKDLTFAILMSTNDSGNINVAANWDKVTETMHAWNYSFTKSAMSQHWSKKVLKEFKDRHASDNGGSSTPNKATATPRKRAPPKGKSPATGRGKKRAASEDADSPDGGFIAEPIAQTKTARSGAKKIKKEANRDAQAQAVDVDEDFVDQEEQMEAEAHFKGEKEDSDYSA